MLTETQTTAFYEQLGDRIRQARKYKNMSQDDLAGFLDISRVSLVHIENGKQKVPTHVLLEISKHLNIGLPDLIPPLITQADAIDPSTLNKINKEAGENSESADKAINFIK